MNFDYGFGQKENSLSVGDLNRYVKMLMDGDALLSSVSVRGEISNLKYHTSGHLYFTLKDEESEISAVMFRSSVSGMRFVAKNGMKVTAYGRVSVYEKSGKYQLYVGAMTDDGVGKLQLEYERLLQKLKAEGLFDIAYKKPLPKYPECIGIITSPTGAAVKDMINVTGRRWPMAKILLYPSLVQGDAAPDSLCRGLEYLNADGSCDVIIIGRGGGSIEDLWAFNDERVVRAIAASAIPIISAVGHETDFTLSDFAADCRAPTPSAAAELAVPDRDELKMRIDDAFLRLEHTFERSFTQKRKNVAEIWRRLELSSPMAKVKTERELLFHKYERLLNTADTVIKQRRDRLLYLVGRLEATNPLAVLSRGYSVAANEQGKVLTSVNSLSEGDCIRIKFSDGSADASITSISKTAKRSVKKNISEGKSEK